MSSIITIVGAKLANKTPDRSHPYGHGRIEYVASPTVSAIVFYAGITTLIESVKKTEGNSSFGMSEALPYEGAKKMYLVDEVDDRERLKEIVKRTVKRLQWSGISR
ncbi:MAG: cation transporter [Candidatus Saccharibacteria bacterium]|nr:cation transporter [Candidatus Saccharibacteria bacterium]